MSFIADKQTLDDLGILNRYRSDAVFTLFNQVKTNGGERLLEEMFRNVLTNEQEMNDRSNTFRYFQQLSLVFPFSREQADAMEDYLGAGHQKGLPATLLAIVGKKLTGAFVGDKSFVALVSGVQTTIAVLKLMRTFVNKIDEHAGDHPFSASINELKRILDDKRIAVVWKEKAERINSVSLLAKFDYLFRAVLYTEMKQLLTMMYQLDVIITVSNIAKDRGFSYATALEKGKHVFRASDLRHPGIKKAVGNTLELSAQSNLIFLTGANMAGKSTIMKSFGIAVYMAHIGFPVAASEMTFSVKDGLFSSINVPDNLQMGYSHFYAEVLRVKKVAEAVAKSKDLVIIFDELFKGTNVKDAYDATLSVTKAFATFRNCFFLVSTHIVEVGAALQEDTDDIQFLFMPTIMEGNVPRYTYQLTKGISADRHGMKIIENEGIIDIIRSAATAFPDKDGRERTSFSCS